MPIVIENWAHSPKKRPIALYKSTETPLHPILLIGGVHGDEPEGVALAEATLQWLKSNSAQKTTLDSRGAVEVAPWMLITCLNPDGYANRTRVNGNGVDLNRNYPSHDWSPEAKAERYSPGPHPASEPEIQALVQLITTTQPRLVIHCHSWKPCIVYTGENAKTDALALGRSSGYEVVDDIGYPTPGSLSRWGWHDNGVPIICIEAAEGSPLQEVWPRFANGIREIFTNTSMRRPLNGEEATS